MVVEWEYAEERCVEAKVSVDRRLQFSEQFCHDAPIRSALTLLFIHSRIASADVIFHK